MDLHAANHFHGLANVPAFGFLLGDSYWFWGMVVYSIKERIAASLTWSVIVGAPA